MIEVHPFQTERLHARPIAVGDQALYLALYSDMKVMLHIGSPLTLDAAARGFAEVMRQAGEQAGSLSVWVLSERVSDVRIGILALSGKAGGESLELGAMLLPEAQGRGFAAESQAALLDRLFQTTRIRAVWSRNAELNLAARSVRMKLGFLQVSAASQRGELMRWEMTRARWQALRASKAAVDDGSIGGDANMIGMYKCPN
ncbi:MAG: GNAT family N-acetyltransferase [Pseudomonadota bacterium]|nr:GNAT family N-acetyltransferase [Pseudomonadota bacterium]